MASKTCSYKILVSSCRNSISIWNPCKKNQILWVLNHIIEQSQILFNSGQSLSTLFIVETHTYPKALSHGIQLLEEKQLPSCCYSTVLSSTHSGTPFSASLPAASILGNSGFESSQPLRFTSRLVHSESVSCPAFDNPVTSSEVKDG